MPFLTKSVRHRFVWAWNATSLLVVLLFQYRTSVPPQTVRAENGCLDRSTSPGWDLHTDRLKKTWETSFPSTVSPKVGTAGNLLLTAGWKGCTELVGNEVMDCSPLLGAHPCERNWKMRQRHPGTIKDQTVASSYPSLRGCFKARLHLDQGSIFTALSLIFDSPKTRVNGPNIQESDSQNIWERGLFYKMSLLLGFPQCSTCSSAWSCATSAQWSEKSDFPRLGEVPKIMSVNGQTCYNCYNPVRAIHPVLIIVLDRSVYVLWFLTSSIFHLKFQVVCFANLLPAKRASKRSSVFSRCRVAASSCQECTCHSQRLAPGIGFHGQRIQPPNEVDGFHAKESPVSKESSPPFWLTDSKIKKFVLHWHLEQKVNTNFPIEKRNKYLNCWDPQGLWCHPGAWLLSEWDLLSQFFQSARGGWYLKEAHSLHKMFCTHHSPFIPAKVIGFLLQWGNCKSRLLASTAAGFPH